MARWWNIRALRASTVALVALMALTACGGGGGGGAEAPRTALPQVVSDDLPAGERIDARAAHHFPSGVGDRWTYRRVVNGSESGTVTREVEASTGADLFRVTEVHSSVTYVSDYRRSAEGWLLLTPLYGVLPLNGALLVGDILEFAEPFYAVGAVRRVIRQGPIGRDLDLDGVEDSFRLEYTQVFQGFEAFQLADGRSVQAARFRSTIIATVQPSLARLPVRSSVSTEDTWWGPGIGLLRADRSLADAGGTPLQTPYRLELMQAQVGGRPVLGPGADGAQSEIALPHRALIFDATRSRYYASVPGTVADNSHRIAIIDPADGSMTFSRVVGSEPGALALAHDGTALYVGLQGSGELLKLRLPDFVELQRMPLPRTQADIPSYPLQITVSPIDADVVAVSLQEAGGFSRSIGVALLRGGVPQPRLAAVRGEVSLVSFAADGQSVFGFDNASTEFGLRRLAVLPDGLQEAVVVPTVGTGFDTRALDLGPAGLVLGKSVYRPDDLTLCGTAVVQGGCRSAGSKLVCLYENALATGVGRLAVLDARTLAVEATPFFQLARPSGFMEALVVGAPGQVALRSRQNDLQSLTDTITLVRASTLP